MAKRKLTDSELATRDGRTSAETLRKREQRARQKLKATGAATPQRPRLATVTALPPSAPTEPAAGKELTPHAQEIFTGIKQQMVAANRWSEAVSPILKTYARASAAIDEQGIEGVSNGLLVAQCRAAQMLDLPTLPAAKRAASERDQKRYFNW